MSDRPPELPPSLTARALTARPPLVNAFYTAACISSLTPSPMRAIIALDSAGRKRARRKSAMVAQALDLFATIEGHCLARMDISHRARTRGVGGST